jgi:rhamnosyltransferase subunit B
MTQGTAGDVLPLLGIAQQMRDEAEVTFITNPFYAALIHAASPMKFQALGTLEHHVSTFEHPKIWHPMDGFGVLWRYLLRPGLIESTQILERMAEIGPLTIVAPPHCFGARLVKQKHAQVRLVTTHTAPTSMRPSTPPIAMGTGLVRKLFVAAAGAWIWKALDRFKLDPLVGPDISAAANELGVDPGNKARWFDQWACSPDVNLALFPASFAQHDRWPGNLVHTGFPVVHSVNQKDQSHEVLDFLQRNAGKLVVATAGTAHRHTQSFVDACRRICRELDLALLLISPAAQTLRNTAQSPPELCIRAVHLPEVLAKAQVFIHHGGIGSIAQALRAGVRQVVVPFAFDQFDNAHRLEQKKLAQVAWFTDWPTRQQRMLDCTRYALRKDVQPLVDVPDVNRNGCNAAARHILSMAS